jgi:hypothetical protein
MQKIDILGMAPHEWAVTVTEGVDTTNHHVTVSEQLIDDLGIVDLDEEELVRETFKFLLERDTGDSIRHEFDLDEMPDEFPDYIPEIKTRLAA